MEDIDRTKTQKITILPTEEVRPVQPSSVKHAHRGIYPENVSSDTHCGFVRKRNEDSFACCLRPDGKHALAAVADGVGGESYGDIASRLCTQRLIRLWRKYMAKNPPDTSSFAETFLRDAIESANTDILAYTKNLKQKVRMGTTVAALFFSAKTVTAANAGDSRIYRLRAGKIQQISRDHTIVAAMIESGEITPEQARKNPLAHIITRSLGILPIVNPEIRTFPLEPGDRFLLCSDGITGHLNDDRLRMIMESAGSPEQCMEHIFAGVFAGGATDNMTAVVIFA